MLAREKPLPVAPKRPTVSIWLLTLLAVVIAAGCQQRDEITRYTVNKPPPLEPLARANPHQADAAEAPPTGEPTDRTLGAIVPLAEQGWFFKLTGPTEPVAALQEVFADFVKSVRFGPDGKPAWTLPEGWTEQPGGQIRYATLVIPGAAPLELSVTVLPKSGDDESYALLNVNRWRGQLRLEPTTAAQLAGESNRLELDGATATLVNLVGHAAPGTMGRPPFFSGAPDGD
jgi:hypothetical protein